PHCWSIRRITATEAVACCSASRSGCGSFGVRRSCGEFEAGLVAAEVVALVFLLDVPVPVGAGVAAGADGAQPDDGLGAGQAPAGAGDAHPVVHEVAAGAFDDA